MTHLTAAELLGTPAALDLKDEERQPCEVWTRVMGYHRPVSSFNRGKQGEFADRVAFCEPARSGG
ncbi:hypothetical protein GGD89_002678 [Roseospira visakhapatnamensis]|uniref:Uncharacterized protein n=1 Tax=Roseospira visakhapatnamensis TaxID=390880 RepID=A0A7W6REG0_9PROT|nr:hypothetical protein [Roseospira visakhapatnamensis]